MITEAKTKSNEQLTHRIQKMDTIAVNGRESLMTLINILANCVQELGNFCKNVYPQTSKELSELTICPKGNNARSINYRKVLNCS